MQSRFNVQKDKDKMVITRTVEVDLGEAKDIRELFQSLVTEYEKKSKEIEAQGLQLEEIKQRIRAVAEAKSALGL